MLPKIVPFFVFLGVCLCKEIMLDLSKGDTPSSAVRLSSDDTLHILLRENPSAGYSWRVFRPHISDEKELLQVVNQEYIEPATVSGDIQSGAAGVKDITLQPNREKLEHSQDIQEETLELVYCRPWEITRVLNQEDGTIDWDRAVKEDIFLRLEFVKVQVSPVNRE